MTEIRQELIKKERSKVGLFLAKRSSKLSSACTQVPQQEGGLWPFLPVLKVNMRVTQKFKFRQAQCLFGDGVTDDILFHRREVVRVEGDKFHHQIHCALEKHGSPCFVEEDSGIFLVLLGYLNMDSPHSLALG